MAELVPFISKLDLSHNKFSGKIPMSFSNCSYLNVFRLDHNQLTGEIPPELGLLNCIKVFNVSNDSLRVLFPFSLLMPLFGHNQSNSYYFCVLIIWPLCLRSKGKRRWHYPRGGVLRTKIKKLIKSTTYQSPGRREQKDTFSHSSKIRNHLLSPWFKIFGRN